MLWRTICASGFTRASPSIATATTWTTARGSHRPRHRTPATRTSTKTAARAISTTVTNTRSRVSPNASTYRSIRRSADATTPSVPRHRTPSATRDSSRSRGVARGCPARGDGHDDEREGGDDHELREPLPGVLRVGQAGGLQHVPVPPEQCADLHHHEQQHHRVQREHRHEPLAALRRRAGRKAGVGPARRCQGEVRQRGRDEGHEDADDDLTRQQVRLDAGHQAGEDAVGAREQQTEHEQQPDGDRPAAQRDRQLTSAGTRQGLEALGHPRQRPDGARRPGQRGEHRGRRRPGRRHRDDARPRPPPARRARPPSPRRAPRRPRPARRTAPR